MIFQLGLFSYYFQFMLKLGLQLLISFSFSYFRVLTSITMLFTGAVLRHDTVTKAKQIAVCLCISKQFVNAYEGKNRMYL